jgi:hypothetical protein
MTLAPGEGEENLKNERLEREMPFNISAAETSAHSRRIVSD